MRLFTDHNPYTLTASLLGAGAISMFATGGSIVMPLIAAVGAGAYMTVKAERHGLRTHSLAIILILLSAVINPLFNNRGETVLFVLNDRPITLESLLTGVATGLSIAAALYCFDNYTRVMTSDKVLYLFGSFAPRLSLTLSMALRYVPLLRRQAEAVGQAQQGLYIQGSPRRSASIVRKWNSLLMWSLENGVITADSMASRGYGSRDENGRLRRRASYTTEHFTLSDAVIIIISIALVAGSFTLPQQMLRYVSCAVLAFMPIMFEIRERMQWHILKSRI